MSSRSALDRRRFLKLGVMASGAAAGCMVRLDESPGEADSAGMQYRVLGSTGLRVSEISFGAHGLDNPSLMGAAIEAGINTFATSGNYMDGREEAALGQAMQAVGRPRDEIVVLTGNPVRPGITRQSILQDVDASLRRLRTEYIDIYCTGDVGTASDLRIPELFEAMDEAKRQGKVRHLALAGHQGGMQDVLEAAIDDGRFDIFFVKYDFVSYPDQDAILRRAAGKGIGTIVFKTNAGARENEIRDLEAKGLSFRQAAARWALAHSYVASVCISLTSFNEIREFAAVPAVQISQAEWQMLRRYAGEMYDRYCRFCRTCEATCPRGVAVADVMRYEMYFTSYRREKEAMRLYASLPPGRTAGACTDCAGACEGSCPFGRRIRGPLLAAHSALSVA